MTNDTNDTGRPAVRRLGQVVQLRPGMRDEYVALHSAVWPEVDAAIRAANITKYSIFELDGLLFAYLEYSGDDFDGDMTAMADNPDVQRWWQRTDACQQRLDGTTGTQMWATMDEVYRLP